MAEHAHAAGSHGDHDHNHEVEHIRGHIKIYFLIFAMLILGTIVTVAISYVDFGAAWINITIGLIIATIKATLVAGWFMHLVSERRMVHSILTVCGFMFGVLVFLFVWTMTPDSLIGGGKHQHLRASEGAAIEAPATHAPAH